MERRMVRISRVAKGVISAADELELAKKAETLGWKSEIEEARVDTASAFKTERDPITGKVIAAERTGLGTNTITSRRQQFDKETHDMLIEAQRRTQQELGAAISRNFDEYTKDLDPETARVANSVYVAGQETDSWIKDSYIDSLGLEQNQTNKVKEVMHKFRDDSDKSYYVDNHQTRSKMEADGWKYDADEMEIVKEIDSKTFGQVEFNKMLIQDPDGNILNFKNSSVESIKKRYLDNGEYRLLRADPGSVRWTGSKEYTHRIVRAGTELTDLPEFVLPYSPGGPRRYTNGTHFVKVGRTFYDEGNTKFLGYAKTLISGSDVKRLNKYANDVNKVVRIYNDFKDDLSGMQRALDEADLTEFKIETVDELLNTIRTKDNPMGLLDADPNITNAKVYRKDEKFVYDSSLTSSSDFVHLDNLDDYDKAKSDLMALRNDYYRSKGDQILDNINTKSYDHVVDMFEIWQKNVTDAILTKNFDPIMADWGDWFKNKFIDVIDPETRKNINKMSGEDVIMTAKISAPNESYRALANEAARAQASYKNIKNIPTKIDESINNHLTNLITALPRGWWDNSFVDSLRTVNPVKWANTVIFRNYLGFFNAAQFYKNGILPVINMLSLDTNAWKAVRSAPAVVAAHFMKGEGAIKNGVQNLLRGIGGLTPEQLDEFLGFMDNYGTFKQMSQRPELYRNNMFQTLKGWDGDLVFLKAGNNMAQLIADLTGYLKYGNDWKKVVGYADDLMGNTNRVNTSAFQRSTVGQLVGQFTSYPISVIETMTGKQFTPAQKASFMATQFFMWGVGGTVARDLVTNMYEWMRGDEVEDDEWSSFVCDGLMTEYFAQKGYDVREGADLVGLFDQMSGLVYSLTSIGGGEAPDLPISNIYSILEGYYKAIKDITAPTTDTRDLLYYFRRISEAPQAPTGLRNIANAVIAMDARQMWDKNGDILRKDVDTKRVFMTLLGFKDSARRLKEMDYKTRQIEERAITEMFETSVKPFIEKINTYRRTGEGLSELTKTRSASWGEEYHGLENAVRGFKSWVRQFHPDYTQKADSLIQSQLNAGKDSFKYFIQQAPAIHERNAKRLHLEGDL